jgi:LysR family transcriptional regulator, glycine cleavage system transcriptional activator
MSVRAPALESLRYLEACVRHANFSRAADELGVTPAAVSLRIRDLEAILEKRLFHRSGPKITPTRAGSDLAQGVAEGLRRVQMAVEECRERAETLRVTAVPSFATRWLAPRLCRFHAIARDLSIELDVSTELRGAVSFDVAIRTGFGDWPDVEASALMAVDATPMLRPDLALTISLTHPCDLATLRLLPHDQWARWFREAGSIPSTMQFYEDDYPTHELDAMAAMEGAGVALLSPTLFASLLREGKLVQPFAHVIRGPMRHYVVTPCGQRSPAARRFRAWLQEEARIDAER